MKGKENAKVDLPPPSADAWVSPDKIERNPANPRLIFHQKQLDDLKKSIYEVGILNPLVVYEKADSKGSFVLIDGERRWRSARELNLRRLPVHVHTEPDPVQNLTMMFNIHKLRVDWELMPTALSLQKLMELSGETRQKELARITGMSSSMVKKALNLLSFPEKHQKMVLDHKVKDNLLLEIYDVLQSLEKNLPKVVSSRGRESIVDSILAKEQQGQIKTVTELRDFRKVIESTAKGAPENSISKIVSKVLDTASYTIETAYSKVRALYDVGHLTNQFNSLADQIGGFKPDEVDSADLKKLRSAVRRVSKEISSMSSRIDVALSGAN